MSHCPNFTHLLVMPHLRVQAANAISSPLTHGFPSMTAFIGLKWALQRKASAAGLGDLKFRAVGVVCHGYQELVSDGYIKSFCLTRNPVARDGKTAAIVEEGRIHLEISLVFAVHTAQFGVEEDQALAEQLSQILQNMRVAGGTLLPPEYRSAPYWVALTGDPQGKRETFEKIRMRLLPGFALVSRDDLLAEELARQQSLHPAATVLDAWLSRSRWNWSYQPSDSQHPGKGRWQHDRGKGSGWIVPIPVGYAALSPLQPPGSVAHTRDGCVPFCCVESLYSLGEWISPHRLHAAEQLLWYAGGEPEQGRYRCLNDYPGLSC